MRFQQEARECVEEALAKMKFAANFTADSLQFQRPILRIIENMEALVKRLSQ